MTVYLHQSESEYVNAPLVSTPARNFSLSGGVNMIFTRTRDRPFFARKPCFLWRGPPNSGNHVRNWDRRPGRTAALAARAGAGSLRFDPLIIPVKRHRGEPGHTWITQTNLTTNPHIPVLEFAKRVSVRVSRVPAQFWSGFHRSHH